MKRLSKRESIAGVAIAGALLGVGAAGPAAALSLTTVGDPPGAAYGFLWGALDDPGGGSDSGRLESGREAFVDAGGRAYPLAVELETDPQRITLTAWSGSPTQINTTGLAFLENLEIELVGDPGETATVYAHVVVTRLRSPFNVFEEQAEAALVGEGLALTLNETTSVPLELTAGDRVTAGVVAFVSYQEQLDEASAVAARLELSFSPTPPPAPAILPEPTTGALVGLGIAALAAARRGGRRSPSAS